MTTESETIERLRKENEELRKEIESLTYQLERAEAMYELDIGNPP